MAQEKVEPHKRLENKLKAGEPVTDKDIYNAIRVWREDNRYMYDEACDLLNMIAKSLSMRHGGHAKIK